MTTSTTKPVSGKPRSEPEVTGHMPITVSYGPNSQQFDVPRGSTVGSALDNPYTKEVIGYQGGSGESIVVNGQPAERNQVLNPTDRLEVIKQAGDKA